MLFYAGELADGGYVVQEGSLLLEPGTLSEGKEIIVGPGTLLGELALLTDTVRPATAIAHEPSTVIRISRSLFLQDAGRLSGRRASNCATVMARARCDALDARARRREARCSIARRQTPR